MFVMNKRSLTILAFSAFLLASCDVGGDQEPIKIGYIGPLTGDANTYGLDTLHGAEIKVEEINAAGGINGRPIEFVVEDARCTGSDSAAAAQKLINIDGVIAIVGGICSGETLAAAPIVEAAKVPLMSPGSTSPDVKNAGDFVFRNIPSDALAADATAKYLKNKELTKVAMITENTDFAMAFGNSLVSNLEEGSVIFNEIVEPNTKDFRTLVTRLQGMEFDAFIANAQTTAVGAAMAVQFREQGFEQPIFTNNGVVSPVLGELAGEAAEGMKAVMPPSEGANAQLFNAFVAKFTEKYGTAASSITYAANSHDVVGVFAQAIGVVGMDGVALRDYFYNFDGYDGTVGRFSFDQYGEVVGIDLEIQELKDGEFVKIENVSLAQPEPADETEEQATE